MSRGGQDQDEFESCQSAKLAVLLCYLFREPGRDEADLRTDLIALAIDPAIARQLVRILATDADLATRFDDVRAAALATLRRDTAGWTRAVTRDPGE